MGRVILVLVVFALASCSIQPEPDAAVRQVEVAEKAAKPTANGPVAKLETRTEPAVKPKAPAESAAKPVPAVKPEPRAVAAVQKRKPVRVRKPAPKVPASVQMEGKRVIGGIEAVRIIPGDFVFPARIDTGAKTSSLHAEELQLFERDGKRWVRFRLTDGSKSRVVEKKVIRRVRIKQQDAPPERRPVVKMRFILGGVSQSIQVTLTDRSNFQYKVLVGRNFLHDVYIVDVGQKMTTQPILYKDH